MRSGSLSCNLADLFTSNCVSMDFFICEILSSVKGDSFTPPSPIRMSVIPCPLTLSSTVLNRSGEKGFFFFGSQSEVENTEFLMIKHRVSRGCFTHGWPSSVDGISLQFLVC